MPAPGAMSVATLAKLIGTARAPVVLDVRRDALRQTQPQTIVGARIVPEAAMTGDGLAAFVEAGAGPVVVACAAGHGRSQGAAALLREAGVAAVYLDGGREAWVAAGGPLVDLGKVTGRDGAGRSLWVTRARPKVDRIACPWLIRRFVDPRARFLFVQPAEVEPVAAQFGAMPFDIEGVFWSHRGGLCTFDVMLAEFGMKLPALDRVATIVRAADTAQPELAPETAGLLAISLGLSRMYPDDLAQLEAGMTVYDALYRWARDAPDETHYWPAPGAKP
jgi:rhodanese-related sulfurtransferase